MKMLLVFAMTLIGSASFASTQAITCTNNSNADLQLQIKLVDSQIVGASLFNIDWSESADRTYQAAKAVGVVNPMVGVQVILEDGKTLDIDYAVLAEGHAGSVVVDSSAEYTNCY